MYDNRSELALAHFRKTLEKLATDPVARVAKIAQAALKYAEFEGGGTGKLMPVRDFLKEAQEMLAKANR